MAKHKEVAISGASQRSRGGGQLTHPLGIRRGGHGGGAGVVGLTVQVRRLIVLP